MNNYFLKDIIELYPLADNVEFPEISDYLVEGFADQLTDSGLYDEDKILARIERKYKYNEIATSDISQFYDLLNELIEENFSEYLMNLVAISDFYSIQNIDTKDMTFKHTIDTEGKDLIISNDTPGNKLNIANIKAGTSASSVEYNTTSGEEYTETTHQESTSALNTTQSNIEYQLKVNRQVQEALNKFIDNLGGAFSIVQTEYYD